MVYDFKPSKNLKDAFLPAKERAGKVKDKTKEFASVGGDFLKAGTTLVLGALTLRLVGHLFGGNK